MPFGISHAMKVTKFHHGVRKARESSEKREEQRLEYNIRGNLSKSVSG
jgi:hypothetical protein